MHDVCSVLEQTTSFLSRVEKTDCPVLLKSLGFCLANPTGTPVALLLSRRLGDDDWRISVGRTLGAGRSRDPGPTGQCADAAATAGKAGRLGPDSREPEGRDPASTRHRSRHLREAAETGRRARPTRSHHAAAARARTRHAEEDA